MNFLPGVNLLQVAVHEFGHSLGLLHSNVEDAIMYAYYPGYIPDLKLHSDDIAGIQHLYGVNEGTVAPVTITTREPTTNGTTTQVPIPSAFPSASPSPGMPSSAPTGM